MVIENRLPEKQKAHGACNTVGLISIRREVIGQCRRHQSASLSSQQRRGSQVGKAASLQGATTSSILVHASTLITAPTVAETTAETKIRTAEAVQTFQSHYRPFSVRSQGDFTDDVPQLPNRM